MVGVTVSTHATWGLGGLHCAPCFPKPFIQPGAFRQQCLPSPTGGCLQHAVLTSAEAMLPGVRPIPPTALVELPPLLAKITDPLNVPDTLGAKATVTVCVCPPATL